MHARPAATRLALRAAAALLALALAACAHRSTAPPGAIARSTTVTLTDSLGGTGAGQPVWLLDLDATAPEVFPRYTDGLGRVTAALGEGPWLAYTRVGRTCAGGTFHVAGSSRPRTDTVDVRLRLRAESWLRGTVTLADRVEAAGTLCTLEGRAGDAVLTDDTGSWLMDGVPPGTWTLEFAHFGYVNRVMTATVPGAADTVTVANVTLLPALP